MAAEAAKNKAARLLKKRASVSSVSSDTLTRAKNHGSMSTISFMAEPAGDGGFRAAQQLENTFRMEPCRAFPTGQVEAILAEVLHGYLAEERYEPELARQMSKTITDVVKARVKDLCLARYKLISLVHVGQLHDHGLRMGSRCLWDANNDSFASYEFRNNSLFAVAQVYGVFTE